jgi:hypothetical protein
MLKLYDLPVHPWPHREDNDLVFPPIIGPVQNSEKAAQQSHLLPFAMPMRRIPSMGIRRWPVGAESLL